jgi:hypothetical protein
MDDISGLLQASHISRRGLLVSAPQAVSVGDSNEPDQVDRSEAKERDQCEHEGETAPTSGEVKGRPINRAATRRG